MNFALEMMMNLYSNDEFPQGMGQGNDRGTQYRSGIYCNDETELTIARASRDAYEQTLKEAGHRNGAQITTEVIVRTHSKHSPLCDSCGISH